MRYWNTSGVPRDKLNLGISTYGRSYILDDPVNDHKIGALVSKPGPKGVYTREVGFQAYYEVSLYLFTFLIPCIHPNCGSAVILIPFINTYTEIQCSLRSCSTGKEFGIHPFVAYN